MKIEMNNRDISKEIDEVLKEKEFQIIIKRIFDIIVSFIGLIVLLPVFLIIGVAIKLDSKGPVLYRQTRVGRGGKNFRIYKFRTMVIDADKKGMQITVGEDNRVTRLGSFLRKFKMDELPQLINVLIGNMSFVGPRPEVNKYVEIYTDRQRDILKVRPGITDIASIEYRNESDLLAKSLDPENTYINEIMPRKIKLNMKYLQNISLCLDIKLIFKTLFVIIR